MRLRVTAWWLALTLVAPTAVQAQPGPPEGPDTVEGDDEAGTEGADEGADEPASIRDELEALRAELDQTREELRATREDLDAIRGGETAVTPEDGAGEAADEVRLDETLTDESAEDDAAVDAFLADLESTEAEGLAEPEPFQLYGFMDVGFRKMWMRDAFIGYFVPTRETSFVFGNLNFYFDFHPHPDWRALVELRFTNFPHGQNLAYGDPFGAVYERVDKTFYDYANPSGRDFEIEASALIERAQIEWHYEDRFNLRAGYLLTPYGIWNIDHGTPTLISMILPTFQVDEYFPERQLGVEAFGTLDLDDWQLGYNLYVTNGRTPTEFDFTDDKAFGGRIHLRRSRPFDLTVGVSGYWGTYNDHVRNITSVEPFVIEWEDTVRYREFGLAADVSIDIDRLRIRWEAILHRVDYEEGFREPAFGIPGTFAPDRWETNTYVIGAYRLPWLGLEPYVFLEFLHRPTAISDTLVFPSLGLNVHINAAAQIKLQYAETLFYNLATEGDASGENFGVFTSRLVLAF